MTPRRFALLADAILGAALMASATVCFCLIAVMVQP